MHVSRFFRKKDLSGLRKGYVRAFPYDLNFRLLFVDGTPAVGSAVTHMAVYALSDLITLLVFVFAAATLAAARFSAAIILCVPIAVTIVAPQRRWVIRFRSEVEIPEHH